MSSKEDKEFSLVLCSTLDNLGFKKENISTRTKSEEEQNKSINLKLKNYECDDLTIIPAGSFGEGMHLSDSDLDFMVVSQDALCLDHGDVQENFIILETDYISTSPGYTKLISNHEIGINMLLSPSLFMDFICNSMTCDRYISSEKFRKEWFELCSKIGEFLVYDDHDCEITTTGPALTNKVTTRHTISDSDNVYCMYFYGGEYLRRWANRTRYYHWPSDGMVKEISEMEGYVVPVGDKQSENSNLEWRICYTTAEKKLVSNLNDIQLKLYVLLKLLSKHILKPVCKALTSYVVKNVVFWISETTSQDAFTPDCLVFLVLKSLHFIKYCIENNHFPNYMIQERNLLRGAVCDQEKQVIINFLSQCLSDGGHVLLKIPKLYHGMSIMVKNPEGMVSYGTWRDELERLRIVLEKQMINNLELKSAFGNRRYLFHELNAIDEIKETLKEIFLLVIPDSGFMLLSGMSLEDILNIFYTRLKCLYLL